MATLTVPSDCLAGDRISVVGAAFANSTAYTLRAVSQKAELDVIMRGTTSGGGAFTNTDLVAPGEGMINWTASDGSTTVVGQTRVFRR